MESAATLEKARSEGWTDEVVVARVRAGDTALYELVMRRYNQRLYRIARAILRDDAEAEDVMQDAYVRAYQHLDQFAGRSRFSAWLTRIAVNEALARRSSRNRTDQLEETEVDGEFLMTMGESPRDPEESAATSELGRLLEEAVLSLPQNLRTVIVLRDVEDLSTSETAEALGLSEENVKVRLHRGRALLREWLFGRVGAEAKNAFPFMGVRCDRVVHGVLLRLADLNAIPPFSKRISD